MFTAPRRGVTLPYLSREELSVAPAALRHLELPENADQNARLHYPFSELERGAVETAARRYREAHITLNDKRPAFDWLKKCWRKRQQAERKKLIDRVADEASDTAGLNNRTKASIRSYLIDLVQGHSGAISARIAPKQAPNFAASLLSRSLGYSRSCQLRTQCFSTIAPFLSFHDLSGEVNTVAFHPNGSTFAAGTICFTDRYNVEYNDPGSLVVGNVNEKHIVKIADHWRAQEGPECSPEVTDRSWQTTGRELYYTVASVGFSKAGTLYSAGRDGKLLAYDTDHRIIGEYTDEAGGCPPVECMSVARDNNVVAIGRRTAKDSVVILRHEETGFTTSTFGLSRDVAELGNDMIISPATLDLGIGQYSNLLVAGYSAHKKTDAGEEDASVGSKGQMCLFDITTKTQLNVRKGSVFATAWSPNYGNYFATACTPTTSKDRSNKGVKSLVRIYSPSHTAERFSLDCFAHDINELAIW
jgi:WD40 repeat protein